MSSIEALFGAPVDPLTVVGCQMRRREVRVSSLSGAATAAALGMRPTWCVLTLSDGRTLTARTRGSGPEHEALEAFARSLNETKLRAAREALARGGSVDFGPRVQVRPDGLTFKGKTFTFAELVGFTVDEGHFMADGPKGLCLTLPLGTTDFGDALVPVLTERLQGKHYAEMTADQLPRFGFLAPSARTHIPGTPTGRQRLAVLGGLVLVGLLALGGYWAQLTYEHEVTLPAWWAQNIDKNSAIGRDWLAKHQGQGGLPECSDGVRFSRERLSLHSAAGTFAVFDPYDKRVSRSAKAQQVGSYVVVFEVKDDRGRALRLKYDAPQCVSLFDPGGCTGDACEQKAFEAVTPPKQY
ncbi:MAG: hypothetical protein K1X89_20755 [Myxococcaceae bacterium]|nr:hypothetical protein [Myxococcaceae bacterium]